MTKMSFSVYSDCHVDGHMVIFARWQKKQLVLCFVFLRFDRFDEFLIERFGFLRVNRVSFKIEESRFRQLLLCG